MQFKIFCPVWGVKHLDLLDKALLKSLSWPLNRAEIEDAEWMVVTNNEQSFLKAQKSIKCVFPLSKQYSFIYPELIDPTIRVEETLLKALIAAMRRCLKAHTPMLMATPDYIFGDGTIKAFKLLSQRDECVSMAHMRVLPDILNKISDNAPTNADLLKMGMDHAHETWKGSEISLHNGFTVFGAIQWQRLSDKITLVRHWIPAPFYVNFTQDDLDFFENFKEGYYNNHLYLKTFALWDHLWAAKVIEQGRLRLIGSSDAAMMIEVTDGDKNLPRPNPIHQTNKDGYILNQPHNHIQRQFISTIRTS